MQFVVQPGWLGGYVYYVWNEKTQMIVEAGGASTHAAASMRALEAYNRAVSDANKQ